VDWTLRRLTAAIAAERGGVSPAQAAKTWATLLKVTRAPPGIFLQDAAWRQVDRALVERLEVALSAPMRERPPSPDFSDVPSLQAVLGRTPGRPLASP
jgi:hypothetical protein